MNRRQFLEAGGGALGAAALCGFARRKGLGTPSTMDAAAFDAERRYVETRFGRIAYVERGSGKAALFLHGFPLNSFQWRGAIERLAPYRRCIAPDFLALGYTDVAEGQSVTPDDQVAMLAEVLDRLRISSVDLIANDSGGAVAQLFIARHRQRVRTLLLTNCDTENDSPPPALQPVIELSRQGKFADQWLASWLADKNLARSAQGIGGMCYADPAHPSDEAIRYYFVPLLVSAQKKTLLHAYALALERNALQGIRPTLQRCGVPTRIVWGAADSIFSAASPDYLDRSFDQSRGVRRLAGRKLFWPEELPEIVADEAQQLWSAR